MTQGAARDHIERAAAPAPRVMYVVGQTLPPYDGTAWELVGVFSAEQLAVDACVDGNYFVMPVVLDRAAPSDTVVHLGTWYPRTEERPTAVWYCEECGVEAGIHIDHDRGAVDGAHLVREAHALRSPSCRVDGSRRIRVRRLSGPADDGRDESAVRAEPVVVGGMA